uniref:Sulfotransferase n=1 Tax=Oryza glumipatula TaxID=40148 RepID=A0A0E0AFR4_9ORYZ
MAMHMHHSLLPASITDNPDCKIISKCRDPKDILVGSMWQFVRRMLPELPFHEGRCLSGPIWDHILGYWNASKANPETVLFLRYEEMLHDPVGTVTKLARFTESRREVFGQRARGALPGDQEMESASARKPTRPKRRQAAEKAGVERRRRSLAQ